MPYRTPESKKGGVSAPPFSMIKLKQPVLGILTYDGCISQMFNDKYTPADLLALYHSMGLNGHNGIDFYKGRGEPIYAAHSGKVIYAQKFASITGNGVKVLDENKGFATLYCHLDSISVVQGQNVTQGQIIGTMGNSGSEYVYMGVHLHFGLYETDLNGSTINTSNGFGGAIDPLPLFIKSMRYVIMGTEQYLLDDTLKVALNIADPTELAKLQLHGLTGTPQTITSLTGYLIYPLVDKARLKDIFGL